MRVLITGGCGFIGANLVRIMKRTGNFDIVLLENGSLGRCEELSDMPVSVYRGDICDPCALLEALIGVEAVIHLAADTRVVTSIEDPRTNFEVNVVGTFELLTAMRKRGVSRLVNASTGGAIIGKVTPPVQENMVPHPISPYGASKLAGEAYCDAFAGSYGFEIASLRFSNVYGPYSHRKSSVVAAFMTNILAGKPITVYGDGRQTRDFIFVDDLCDGVLQALSRRASGVFQLGSGTAMSINELIEMLRDVVAPRPIEVRYDAPRPGEITFTYCDIGHARRVLDFHPMTSLYDGLTRTWAWFLIHADVLERTG